MTDDAIFSDMRAWRESMGLNTYEAAEKLGISRMVIWKLEKDRRAPKTTVQLAMRAVSKDMGTSLEARVAELEADVAALRRILLPLDRR